MKGAEQVPRASNQLAVIGSSQWSLVDSNHRRRAFQTLALPSELSDQVPRAEPHSPGLGNGPRNQQCLPSLPFVGIQGVEPQPRGPKPRVLP